MGIQFTFTYWISYHGSTCNLQRTWEEKNMQRFPRAFILLALISSIIAACGPAAPTLEPGDSERQLTVDGMERSYLLHIPPGVDMDDPSPLVFAFHGAGSDPQEMASASEFSAVSDEAGFILIYPVGLEQTWNAGSCCGSAVEKNIDEAAFVQQILADVEGIAKVDPKRIYATGFSNGGGMVYRLACEMSGTFAAVAPVAGSLTIE